VGRALSPVAARPHDLIRLADLSALPTDAAPAWVGPSLADAPWVVVRRSVAPAGFLAVGVRGVARHERHAALIPLHTAARVVQPEDLRPTDAPTARTPALAALRQARVILDDLALTWGPGGSVGFELATGRPTTTSTSDLDLIIRTDAVPTPTWAADLIDRLSRLSARVDCLVETGIGAIALAELAAAPPTFVLRTNTGPQLVSIEHINAMIAAGGPR